jgi:hypothetical protein
MRRRFPGNAERHDHLIVNALTTRALFLTGELDGCDPRWKFVVQLASPIIRDKLKINSAFEKSFQFFPTSKERKGKGKHFTKSRTTGI